jgi:pimeloyl-ACP methyl ester carboxylesterase
MLLLIADKICAEDVSETGDENQGEEYAMTMTEHRTGIADSGDVRLFYRAFGAPGATPVLIVHGLSFFSYDWIEVAAALAGGREVVAMDMRGFGDSSESPDKDYTVPAFAGDIGALLDHLGWAKAILIGHSMGGRNAVWYTAENPARVEKLILVDYSPQNAPQGSQRVARTVAGLPDSFDSIDAAIAYFGHDADDAQVRARYAAYLRPLDGGGYTVKRDVVFRDRFRQQIAGQPPAPLGVDLWDALGRVSCPILVVRGTRSDLFAAETAERVKTTNSRLSLVEVDAGHNIAGDNGAALIAEISSFL